MSSKRACLAPLSAPYVVERPLQRLHCSLLGLIVEGGVTRALLKKAGLDQTVHSVNRVVAQGCELPRPQERPTPCEHC